MAAKGTHRHSLFHHRATYASRSLQSAQLALRLHGDGRCLQRRTLVHAAGAVVSRDQEQSTAISTKSELFRSVTEPTIIDDGDLYGNENNRQKAVWLAYLHRMQQRKGLRQGRNVGTLVSDNDKHKHNPAVDVPQNQHVQQGKKSTSHPNDNGKRQLAHAAAEEQFTANLEQGFHSYSSRASQQTAKRQKQQNKKTGNTSVNQARMSDSSDDDGVPPSIDSDGHNPAVAKQTIPLLQDNEMASEGAYMNPVYRIIRKAQLLHAKQAAGAHLIQHSQPGSSSTAHTTSQQQTGEGDHASQSVNSNTTDGTSPRIGSVTDCLTLSEDRCRLNPVIRLIRKKELQMAKRGGSSKPVVSASPPALLNTTEEADSMNSTNMSSSTAGHDVQDEAVDQEGFRIIPEHQIASEGARMNPVYRMIRKMELTKKLKRSEDSTSVAAASNDVTYNSTRPTGLASLLSLSDSLLTLTDLDPSHSLASSLDPGGIAEPEEEDLGRESIVTHHHASLQRRTATEPVQYRASRELTSSRPAASTTGALARHAHVDSSIWQAAQPTSSISHGIDHSVGYPQQQQDDASTADDTDWQLPPFPSTGHSGVDRTIRIRQLSLSQRKKQQQAALEQGLPIPYQQQRWFSRQQRQAQQLQPQKWFDDSLMHVSPLTSNADIRSNNADRHHPAVADKDKAVHAPLTRYNQHTGTDSLASTLPPKHAVDSPLHAVPALNNMHTVTRFNAGQQSAANVWKVNEAPPTIPGLPSSLRRRAAREIRAAHVSETVTKSVDEKAEQPGRMVSTTSQSVTSHVTSSGPRGKLQKGSHTDNAPSETRVEAAAEQLARLLGLDAEWQHYERLGLWQEAKQHRDHALRVATKMINKQPNLVNRRPDILEANLLFFCKALGVPRARGVEAVCRMPAVLELAPATVWQRYQHLLTIARQHCGDSIRPLDVSNAAIQSPVLLCLTDSQLKDKMLALASVCAGTSGVAAVSSPAEQQPMLCHSDSHNSSSAYQEDTMLQPQQQIVTVEGAQPCTEPAAQGINMSQAAHMLLADLRLPCYSVNKIRLKAELLLKAAAQHPKWQQELQHMSSTYLARCLKVSEHVLFRLNYLAEHFDNDGNASTCKTVQPPGNQQLQQAMPSLEAISSLQIGDQASSCAVVPKRAKGRPRKPPKIRKPVGRPVSNTLPSIGYILTIKPGDYEARYPGFATWMAGRSYGLSIKV